MKLIASDMDGTLLNENGVISEANAQAVKKAMDKVTKSGGKVLGEPMEIPGIGKYVSFTDTEGNRVSILQPQNM